LSVLIASSVLIRPDLISFNRATWTAPLVGGARQARNETKCCGEAEFNREFDGDFFNEKSHCPYSWLEPS
jgi:hypothetical protein